MDDIIVGLFIAMMSLVGGAALFGIVVGCLKYNKKKEKQKELAQTKKEKTKEIVDRHMKLLKNCYDGTTLLLLLGNFMDEMFANKMAPPPDEVKKMMSYIEGKQDVLIKFNLNQKPEKL